MDRLLTGDVGYGKTEIAVRAAFKAIQDGYQAAVLVPTTLLVTQHAETFAERYAGFPVRIGTLSRFSTPKETEEVKAGLASGEVDLVIGTHSPADRHRLLQEARPGHHRRGAALRRRTQGDPQGAAHRRGRPVDVGHPHPAYPRDGDLRHP